MKPAYAELGKAVIRTEIDALEKLHERIDDNFEAACKLLLACKGRIIVCGVGKSGHIARKIAATLASTGTPAFFVHSTEASHGDMGMFTSKDTVILISNSGETVEVVVLLPLLKQMGIPVISITGNPDSSLAISSTLHINASVDKEACPLNLAPTSSTTAALVLGDALAISLLNARGFTKEDFAQRHPGGSIGRRLLLTVNKLMHKGDKVPRVQKDCPLHDALVVMTEKRLGMTVVLDGDTLVGIYTDGDVRRTLNANKDIYKTPVSEVMTTTPRTIHSDMLAGEAFSIMQKNKITSLVVTSTPSDKHPVGVIHIHDLLTAGVA